MKSINILGPFSTGTNLLNNIISQATDIKTVDLVHKHEVDFANLDTCIKNNPDVLFIVMYRPLFSWIESMIIHSYDIIWNKEDITSNATLFENTYDNITEIYNTYYYNYIELIKKYSNVISLRYYRLIHPTTCYNYILSKLNPFFCIRQSIDKNFRYKLNDLLKKPSKNHGHSVNNNNEAIKNFFNLQDKYKNNSDYEYYEHPMIIYFFEKY
jgi:hypothetical protein